jgi:hypothetical protein
MNIEHANNHVLQLRGDCNDSRATTSSASGLRDHLEGKQGMTELSPVLKALVGILSPMGQRGF